MLRRSEQYTCSPMGWRQRVWSNPPADLADVLQRRGSGEDFFAFYETHDAAPAEELNSLRWIAAGGRQAVHRIERSSPESWSELAAAWRGKPTWWFGVLGYDLKNAFEPSLPKRSEAWRGMPDVALWEPEWVLECLADGTVVEHGDAQPWLQQRDPKLETSNQKPSSWSMDWSAPDYLEQADSLKFHLFRGDIYEVNLCVGSQANGAVNLAAMYRSLQARAEAGMGGMLKWGEFSVVSASPERYLQVSPEGQLRSQPIKGTAPRHADAAKDAAEGSALRQAEKEQAENVMIVDLVRHDFSRVAGQQTVKVPRLLELQSFKTVHHLVSTVEAQLKPGLDWLDAVAASFPMGSMTGAPKLRAMELIDHHEARPRGWYSGAMGYVRPDGSADFNVLIRTLFGHAPTGSWQLWAGSALTLAADPLAEWDECLLKAATPQNVWNESVE